MTTEFTELLGDFKVGRKPDCEYLTLAFSPLNGPLQQRWRNNGLSADFLGDYITSFIPKDESDPRTLRRQVEMRSAVSYVANELLENAMKFHARGIDAPITIHLELEPARILVSSSNSALAPQTALYREYIEVLTTCDPGEMLLARLEASAKAGKPDGSRLGLLTMMNDYGATLGWRFNASQSSSYLMVTTQVTIEV